MVETIIRPIRARKNNNREEGKVTELMAFSGENDGLCVQREGCALSRSMGFSLQDLGWKAE